MEQEREGKRENENRGKVRAGEKRGDDTVKDKQDQLVFAKTLKSLYKTSSIIELFSVSTQNPDKNKYQ